MKIVFFEVEDWMKCCLGEKLSAYGQTELISKPLSIENIREAADAEVISIFIYSNINKDVLDCLPNVKYICTRSAGYDHIDLKECAKRNIPVSNVPRYGDNTVAEHAFALILALARNLKQAMQNTSMLNFNISGLKGFDLQGKTIGIIGAGAIGLRSIKIARGFGMRILAYDVFPQPILSEALGFEYVSLERLLSESDVISIHCPLTRDTKHLINKENIALIKKGAILVNTARGAIVETEAIISALDSGILAGVGLDVLEGEDSIREEAQLLSSNAPVEKLRSAVRNYALLHRKNVIVTPHVGFYSKEAEQRIVDTTIENIIGYATGELKNLIKK